MGAGTVGKTQEGLAHALRPTNTPAREKWALPTGEVPNGNPRVEIAKQAQLEVTRTVEDPAALPESMMTQRRRHSAERLRAALSSFQATRGLSRASDLTVKIAIAWADFSDTSEPFGKGLPSPKEVLSDDEWSIWHTDTYGSRLVRVYHDEIPEFWEVKHAETASNRPMLDDSLGSDLMDRLEVRAQTILDLIES